MSAQKRHFPYYSAVSEIALKKRNISGVNPGREYAEPRTFVPGSPYVATAQGGEVKRSQLAFSVEWQ